MAKHQYQWKKVGIVLAGGGCKGITQLFRLRALNRFLESRDMRIHYIVASSVGVYNLLALAEQPGAEGIEKGIRIWKEHINSVEKVYKYHPILEKKGAELIKQLPRLPLHHHESFRALFEDFLLQGKNLSQLLLFFFWRLPRTFFSVFKNISLDRPQLTPEVETMINRLLHDYIGITDLKALYDPSPLIATLQREIDFQKVVESSYEWQIIAERFEDDKKVIFSKSDFVGLDARVLKIKILERFLACAALYPFFEMVELEQSDGTRAHHIDGDVADPAPILHAFRTGCDAVFVFLNAPEKYPKPKHVGEGLWELYGILTRSLIKRNIVEAQFFAKQEKKDLFVSRPIALHENLGLLNINPVAIEIHERQDEAAMEEYLQNLDAHNLRFADFLDENFSYFLRFKNT